MLGHGPEVGRVEEIPAGELGGREGEAHLVVLELRHDVERRHDLPAVHDALLHDEGDDLP